MNKIVTLVVLVSLALLSCDKIEYKTISKEEYLSKMKAAWIGQMIGVGWTETTEFKYIGKIIPANEVPEYDSNAVNAFGQDDIYVEMTFIKSMEQHGIDCSYKQAGIDFANSEYMLWGANEMARENLRYGIAPPESSHPEYHKGADWIDYQIEADFSGIIIPGMPYQVIDIGEKFGRLMNYGDGLYAGQFIGGLYAGAYFESDIQKIIEAGLACIPSQSQYAECIRDVVRWHKDDPENWENTWQLIEDKYRNNPEYQKYKAVNDDYWVEMDAKLNAAYIVMGLLYGNGDIDKTIIISMRCGRDSDCNPSNAAGVLFASLGMEDIDKKYYEKLNDQTKFSYTNYNFTELVQTCTKLTEQFILKSGGKIRTGKDGKTIYEIPEKAIIPSAFERSWEPGAFDSTNRFSEEELSQINYYPARHYNKYIKEWIPNTWKISHSAKNDKEISISWKGKEGVVLTSVYQKSRGPMIYVDGIELEEGKQHFLSFSVSHEDEGSWELIVNINDREYVKEVINSESCLQGWKEYKIDISELTGTEVFAEIRQEFNGNERSTAYWHELKIIHE
ncbi:hypothetical protein ES705_10802 [subsurface metagenome]